MLCPCNNRDVGSERRIAPRSPRSSAEDAKPRAGLVAAASLNTWPCRARHHGFCLRSSLERTLPITRTGGLSTTPGHRSLIRSVSDPQCVGGLPSAEHSGRWPSPGQVQQNREWASAGATPAPGAKFGPHTAREGIGSVVCRLGVPDIWSQTRLSHTRNRPQKTSTPC